MRCVRSRSTPASTSPRSARSASASPVRSSRAPARVVHAVNLGVDELDLAAAVEPGLGVPVRVENDVKAAAFGAYALHGGSGSMGYLNLGTGIAAGIVADGELWRGARGTAGEVGHISVDPNGPLCRCGQHGCIEAFAGGGAIAERWGRAGALPVRDVFDAADARRPARPRTARAASRAVSPPRCASSSSPPTSTPSCSAGVSRRSAIG